MPLSDIYVGRNDGDYYQVRHKTQGIFQIGIPSDDFEYETYLWHPYSKTPGYGIWHFSWAGACFFVDLMCHVPDGDGKKHHSRDFKIEEFDELLHLQLITGRKNKMPTPEQRRGTFKNIKGGKGEKMYA